MQHQNLTEDARPVCLYPARKVPHPLLLRVNEESKLLATFITTQGRFAFNIIPFGISSALEIFTRTISQILEGVDGVICHMDEIG